jgi:hypothetical protein
MNPVSTGISPNSVGTVTVLPWSPIRGGASNTVTGVPAVEQPGRSEPGNASADDSDAHLVDQF